MLVQCWANVADVGPTLFQHWVNVSFSTSREMSAARAESSNYQTVAEWWASISHCGPSLNHGFPGISHLQGSLWDAPLRAECHQIHNCSVLTSQRWRDIQENFRHRHKIGLILDHHLRRRPDAKPTSDERLVFLGMLQHSHYNLHRRLVWITCEIRAIMKTTLFRYCSQVWGHAFLCKLKYDISFILMLCSRPYIKLHSEA